MASTQKRKRKHLAPDVRRKLADLSRKVGSQQIIQILWRRLSPRERSLVQKNPDIGPAILDIWRKLKGTSLERSILDMALLAGLLAQNDHTFFRGQIGEPVVEEAQDDTQPFWDSDRGQLWFKGQIVRRLRGGQVASCARPIVEAFQAQDWPGRIDDPLRPKGDSERLRDSIRSLNKGVNPQTLLFESDGNGKGVTWSAI